MNLRIGRVSPRMASLLAPGYGHCLRCKTPWRFVKWHDTPYHNGSGCLPLCQKCWSGLTPEQRLPFYHELITCWFVHFAPREDEPTFDETWHYVKTAVLSGL
jgi:hypothetical protein